MASSAGLYDADAKATEQDCLAASTDFQAQAIAKDRPQPAFKHQKTGGFASLSSLAAGAYVTIFRSASGILKEPSWRQSNGAINGVQL